jgi:hypothetical protein
VRARIKDKRALALVKAFLKAGSSPSSATGKTPGPARRRPDRGFVACAGELGADLAAFGVLDVFENV